MSAMTNYLENQLIDHLFRAQAAHEGRLIRTAGGGDHARARTLRQLNCHMSDATRTGMNQHGLPSLQMRAIE